MTEVFKKNCAMANFLPANNSFIIIDNLYTFFLLRI